MSDERSLEVSRAHIVLATSRTVDQTHKMERDRVLTDDGVNSAENSGLVSRVPPSKSVVLTMQLGTRRNMIMQGS